MSTTTLVESILLAASLPDVEISARVADIGPDVVAEAMLAEVACRTALLDGPAEKIVIQCDLGFDDDRLGYLLVLGAGSAYIEKGWDREAPATVRQDLVDMLRELFGPPGRWDVTREISTKHYFDAVAAAGLRHMVGALSQRANLSDLAVLFGTDKWGEHWHTPHYERYFEPYRELPVKVLEIGVGGDHVPDAGGASLRMWKHYFRRGLIYGLDIYEKTGIAESRLHVLEGDQGDQQFLDSMAREIGPFDIVIDDGSHLSHHIINSFNALFRHVRPGGIYVVEDLQTSYWPGLVWGCDADESAQYRTMEMMKGLLDGLHHQEQIRADDREQLITDSTVTGVHVHHNIAFIEKGLNSAPGGLGVPWLRGQIPLRRGLI